MCRAGPWGVDLGHRHFIRLLCEGGWLWWHDCPAVAHVSWGRFGAAPPGMEPSGHRIAQVDPLTVIGSLICVDCGDHGFITAGRWTPA